MNRNNSSSSITGRKRARKGLRPASLDARGLLEACLDPLITISLAGKITDVNKATELVTGLPRDRLIGSHFSGYFTEPEKAEMGYQKVLAEETVRDYLLTIRHVSGRTTDVLCNATVYRNEAGAVLGVFAPPPATLPDAGKRNGGGSSPTRCWRSLRRRPPPGNISTRRRKSSASGVAARLWASASWMETRRLLTRLRRGSIPVSWSWKTGFP
jgi:PAS domain S-box-containing protein